MRVTTNGLELDVETLGNPKDPPMVLVSGFSVQRTWWDKTFCDALAARGFHVVSFDNRDVGLSTKLDAAGVPDYSAILQGDFATLAYSLEDMADDTAGLILGMGFSAAHLVGMSMGGMISQLVAIRHPARVLSVASIMSTTGAPNVGASAPEARAAVLTPPPRERAAYLEHTLATWRVLAGGARTFEEPRMRDKIAADFDRGISRRGNARQAAAIAAATDRTSALARVLKPTVVLHGTEDPLIAASGGEATARAIPGAKLVLLEGMGHDLPPELFSRIADEIAANARRSAAADGLDR